MGCPFAPGLSWSPAAGRVLRIDPDGHQHSFSTRGSAFYLTVDEANHVYVASSVNWSIDVYDTDGNFVTEYVHGEETHPSDLALDEQGNLYLALIQTGKVRKVSVPFKSGTPDYLPGHYGAPAGIAVDALVRLQG